MRTHGIFISERINESAVRARNNSVFEVYRGAISSQKNWNSHSVMTIRTGKIYPFPHN